MLLEADIATSVTSAQSQSCVPMVARGFATKQEGEAALGRMIHSLGPGKSASLFGQVKTAGL